jgi:hypothetical protein
VIGGETAHQRLQLGAFELAQATIGTVGPLRPRALTRLGACGAACHLRSESTLPPRGQYALLAQLRSPGGSSAARAEGSGWRGKPEGAAGAAQMLLTQCTLRAKMYRHSSSAGVGQIPLYAVKRRLAAGEPSTAEIVHEVLRSAEQPLTFEDICARVNARRPVTTVNPRATIRAALSQGPQLVSLGDGHYGYLPKLIEGSVLRLPLTENKPAYRPLIYPDDVRHALFPSCMEIQKRRSERPARVRLSDGQLVELPLEFLGTASWGCGMPDGLRRYLIDNRAVAGDSLVLRVVKDESCSCEAWFERRGSRDGHSVARRNRELADAADRFLRATRSSDLHIWDLIISLLARGAYRSEVAPDPLETVLGADSRFTAVGFGAWMLDEDVTPALRNAIRQRQRDYAQLLDIVRVGSRSTRLPSQGARGWVPLERRHRQSPSAIYQMKVTLKGVRPPIWRRLLIRSDTTLQQLHEVLQAVMGWFDGHLHQFVADGVQYGVPDNDWDLDVQDERRVTVADIAPATGDRFVYEYDFGDGWEHELLVEKMHQPEPGATYPVCLKGRRACPPEDVGGSWGYADFLRILSDPDDPQHEEYLEWVGGEFDPDEFDAAEVSAALERLA